MCNDRAKFEEYAKMAEAAKLAEQKATTANFASREMTINEVIERRIEKHERQVRALKDLQNSLSTGYLTSGASRILPFIEPQ